jgi:dienelactone hydrolase
MHRVLLLTFLLATAACSGGFAHAQAPPQGTFPNGDITLSYRLDRPEGRGPFPAIVIGHGSGRLTKDDHRFFADNLVRRGYIVLRYDKRGVGESGGEYTSVGVTNGEQMIALLASDMAAAAAFLRRQPDVDPARIGLMGASQAGWIIPRAAIDIKPVFMILLSGPAVSIGEEIYYSKFGEPDGASLDKAYDELSRFKGDRGFDPRPILARLDVPGLWLLGQADESIPERDTARILRDFASQGRPFTVVEYPGANHGLFIRAESRMAPYWDDIDRWLGRLARVTAGHDR